MIKCKVCVNHQQRGQIHSCAKCENKTIYGEVIEQFIEVCPYFKMTTAERLRQAYYKKINSLPIDERAKPKQRKKK